MCVIFLLRFTHPLSLPIKLSSELSSLCFCIFVLFLADMSDMKYGYPYPPQGPYQGPPPVAAPPQYYAAPPPKRSPGFLEGCLAALCCCCLLDECCCDPTIIFAS